MGNVHYYYYLLLLIIIIIIIIIVVVVVVVVVVVIPKYFPVLFQPAFLSSEKYRLTNYVVNELTRVFLNVHLFEFGIRT